MSGVRYGWGSGGASRASEKRLRSRRRRVRLWASGSGAVVGLIAMVGLAWGSYYPTLQIKRIEVEGNQILTQQAVAAVAESVIESGSSLPFSRSNVLIFPGDEIERAVLEEFPRVLNAHASLGSFSGQSITLSVEERVPYVRFCDASGCYLVDEIGFIFAREGEMGGGGAIVRDEVFEGGIPYGADGIGGRILPDFFTRVLETVRLLEHEGVNVVKVTTENEQDFSMTLADGAHILARFRDDPALIAENFKAALRSDALKGSTGGLEYLDLRFKNRAYYKFK